mmetsp:Transcript_72477/g.151270  ORF Transcript_72477/g.151270 Transcript_72477/m.151270 type:complete len:93 (-) Transcript_72477:204-482(-)
MAMNVTEGQGLRPSSRPSDEEEGSNTLAEIIREIGEDATFEELLYTLGEKEKQRIRARTAAEIARCDRVVDENLRKLQMQAEYAQRPSHLTQ